MFLTIPWKQRIKTMIFVKCDTFGFIVFDLKEREREKENVSNNYINEDAKVIKRKGDMQCVRKLFSQNKGSICIKMNNFCIGKRAGNPFIQ